jgi:hypothetical protein
MSEKWANVKVNDFEWNESPRRVEKPCGTCGKLTRGRVLEGKAKKPFCIDCGLKKVMQPLQVIGTLLRGLFP